MGLGQPAKRRIRYLLRIVFAAALVTAVVVVGGLVMHYLEAPHEEAVNAQKAAKLAHLLALRSELQSMPNQTLAVLLSHVYSDAVALYHPHRYWDLGGATIYWWTVTTTIGYGTFTAQTSGGKTFTTVMCLASIAVFGYFLTVMTEALSTLLYHLQVAGSGSERALVCAREGRGGAVSTPTAQWSEHPSYPVEHPCYPVQHPYSPVEHPYYPAAPPLAHSPWRICRPQCAASHTQSVRARSCRGSSTPHS